MLDVDAGLEFLGQWGEEAPARQAKLEERASLVCLGLRCQHPGCLARRLATKLIPFQHERCETGLCQEEGGRAPDDPAAYDDDICALWKRCPRA